MTNPICSPSRSAMILGTHQQKSNTHNHRSNREVVLPKPFVPFTQLLRDAGYTTILGHKDVRGKGRKIDVNFKHSAIGTWDGESNFGIYDKYDEFDKMGAHGTNDNVAIEICSDVDLTSCCK